MIRLKQVMKSYRLSREHTVQALHEIDLEIKTGEFVSIVGPSGSGKSTFLALVGLLDRPSEGKMWFAGQDVTDLSDRARTAIRSERCGFIFQFPSLIPTLTAVENVVLPKTLSGRYAGSADLTRGAELLAKVGLADKTDRLPYQLSGGEQRRVAMARALMNEPEIILADEPTGALDDENAKVMMDVFKTMNQLGKTILMVTHDQQLTAYASRTIQIRDGRVV
ncbi:hypothetical protein BEP19_05480 [Ammoniphilus oxalaticus]|uniref:ABC transporter domain-containing protein n=1 Tax=Ammoniphilus oxalaticus TaxID=66863 RepID=A0A419SL50_9BACL|nr:ABC transporter ATP-binding protein [Ammoniphilus oxalaticus]RKD24656.1 hypothetical protein BEP19_05480 [Ammoniphilus oxalaticus]